MAQKKIRGRGKLTTNPIRTTNSDGNVEGHVQPLVQASGVSKRGRTKEKQGLGLGRANPVVHRIPLGFAGSTPAVPIMIEEQNKRRGELCRKKAFDTLSEEEVKELRQLQNIAEEEITNELEPMLNYLRAIRDAVDEK